MNQRGRAHMAYRARPEPKSAVVADSLRHLRPWARARLLTDGKAT